MCICIPRSSLGSESELSSSSGSELGRSLHLKSILSLPSAHSAARMETDLRTQFFIRLRSFLSPCRTPGGKATGQRDFPSIPPPLPSFSTCPAALLSLSNHVANLFGSERKLAFVMLKRALRRVRPSVRDGFWWRLPFREVSVQRRQNGLHFERSERMERHR